MPRTVRSRYLDPLDQIWLAAAARLGLTVLRSPGAYASTDGKGNLSIAPPEDLDADDCLAQIILHEFCHAMVQGEENFHKPDWGLHNDERTAEYQGDTVREQACLRVQRALLRKYGLRQLLAPTTDFRDFYDKLPLDPLGPLPGLAEADSLWGEDQRAIALARLALGRAARAPFAPVLEDALARTAAVHQAASGCDLPEGTLPLLFCVALAPRRHKNGFPRHEDPARTCGDCGWRGKGGRCERSDGMKVEAQWPACVLHEAPLDCLACGACCRHAYDTVMINARDPMRRKHPELVEQDGKDFHLRRGDEGRRCLALAGAEPGPYRCTIYDDRPKICRDYEQGGAHCLNARRRVGTSV